MIRASKQVHFWPRIIAQRNAMFCGGLTHILLHRAMLRAKGNHISKIKRQNWHVQIYISDDLR